MIAPSGGLPGIRRTARSIQSRGNGLSERRDIDFSRGREDLVPKASLKKGREVVDKLRTMAQTTVAEIHDYDDQVGNDYRETPFRVNPSYASDEYGGTSRRTTSPAMSTTTSPLRAGPRRWRRRSEILLSPCGKARSRSAEPRIPDSASPGTSQDARVDDARADEGNHRDQHRGRSRIRIRDLAPDSVSMRYNPARHLPIPRSCPYVDVSIST